MSELSPGVARLIEVLAVAEVADYMSTQAAPDNDSSASSQNPAPLPGYQQAA